MFGLGSFIQNTISRIRDFLTPGDSDENDLEDIQDEQDAEEKESDDIEYLDLDNLDDLDIPSVTDDRDETEFVDLEDIDNFYGKPDIPDKPDEPDLPFGGQDIDIPDEPDLPFGGQDIPDIPDIPGDFLGSGTVQDDEYGNFILEAREDLQYFLNISDDQINSISDEDVETLSMIINFDIETQKPFDENADDDRKLSGSFDEIMDLINSPTFDEIRKNPERFNVEFTFIEDVLGDYDISRVDIFEIEGS